METSPALEISAPPGKTAHPDSLPKDNEQMPQEATVPESGELVMPDSAASELEPEHELIVGLVGAVGTDLNLVYAILHEALLQVNYAPQEIRLSQLLHGLDWPSVLPEGGKYDDYLASHMEAGTQLRELMGGGDAMALLAMIKISQERRRLLKACSPPTARRAYVLRSLKHHKEVETLRRIYGPNFVLLAAYSPRSERVRHLAREIADSHYVFQSDEFLGPAHQLVRTDEAEAGRPLGQSVRKVFPMADVFVDASNVAKLREGVGRFVEILFGYPFHTPTRDEVGMFHARGAALQSASPARQVGAAITTSDGDIIAVGTNEVPKAGGGLYWAGDKPDYRDFALGYDSSDHFKRMALADVLDRLLTDGLLADGTTAEDLDALVKRVVSGDDSRLAGAHLTNLIEFVRAVHAEMAALTDTARRGVPVKGATLYTSTFPCHDCAKHIVAAGIQRVVYIEPYPKSLAAELHPDAIAMDDGQSSGKVVFESFVGVAPRRYMDFFAWDNRKKKDGTIPPWDRTRARLRLAENTPSYLAQLVGEKRELKAFKKQLVERHLLQASGEEDDDD